MLFEKILDFSELKDITQQDIYNYSVLVIFDCSELKLDFIGPALASMKSRLLSKSHVLSIIAEDEEYSNKIFNHPYLHQFLATAKITHKEIGAYLIVVTMDNIAHPNIVLFKESETWDEKRYREEFASLRKCLEKHINAKSNKERSVVFWQIAYAILNLIMPNIDWIAKSFQNPQTMP